MRTNTLNTDLDINTDRLSEQVDKFTKSSEDADIDTVVLLAMHGGVLLMRENAQVMADEYREKDGGVHANIAAAFDEFIEKTDERIAIAAGFFKHLR